MDNQKREVLFDQDHLEVYGLARSFAREVERLLRQLPRGQSDLADQLRRATTSIALNTAEGAGEFKPKEKARFYRIARRSGTESAAVMDTLVDRALLGDPDIAAARRILHRVIGALTRLVRSCDQERQSRSG
jgi:four helix bundle protein